jgi:hypothetical protein
MYDRRRGTERPDAGATNCPIHYLAGLLVWSVVTYREVAPARTSRSSALPDSRRKIVYGQPLTTIHDPNRKVVASVACSLHHSQVGRVCLTLRANQRLEQQHARRVAVRCSRERTYLAWLPAQRRDRKPRTT